MKYKTKLTIYHECRNLNILQLIIKVPLKMIISSDWIGIARTILLSKFIIDPGMHYLIASKPGDTTIE